MPQITASTARLSISRCLASSGESVAWAVTAANKTAAATRNLFGMACLLGAYGPFVTWEAKEFTQKCGGYPLRAISGHSTCRLGMSAFQPQPDLTAQSVEFIRLG